MKKENLKESLLQNPALKNVWGKQKLNFAIADAIINERLEKEMTQKELAKKMGTQQPSIARVENGNILPSFLFLEKVSEALDIGLGNLLSKISNELDGAELAAETTTIEQNITDFEFGRYKITVSKNNQVTETEKLETPEIYNLPQIAFKTF